MGKTLILYYSKTGNNAMVAKQLSHDLAADLIAIRPRLDKLPLILLGCSMGISPINVPLADYQQLVICGPIWMGKLLAPIKQAAKQCRAIGKISMLSCCGSDERHQDGKFGYNPVFAQLKQLLPTAQFQGFALPVSLLLKPEQRDDQEAVMNARVDQDSFHGEFGTQYQRILHALT